MDGDLKTMPEVGDAPRRSAAPRPKTLRWFLIVGLLLLVVLGGLYGFNRYRERAIADFFAHNAPPPAQISAVVAKSEIVPRSATGILFTPGEDVKAGELLVQLNDAPDRGDLANYQAQARLAAVSLDRAQRLARNQYESQANVDQAQSQLDQAKALIQKTEAIIAQKQIRAPFAGRLGVRQIDLGQVLTAGTPIATLTDLSKLYVNFTLPSSMRAELKVGQRVDVTADAFPGRHFTATVTTIEPQISPTTRTITLQATMDNPDNMLLPGMFVNAAVQLPPGPQAVVLPETAVDYTLYGDSVYVVRESGKGADGKPVLTAHRVPVKTGKRWDDKVAILSGVKPGDEVVAAGQIKVQDGGRVVVTGNPPPAPPAEPPLH